MGRLNVVVVSANEHNYREICPLLEQAHISMAPLYSLEGLSDYLRKKPVAVVVLIVDLDTLSVDNDFFHSLKKQYPNPAYPVSLQPHLTYGLEEAMGSASLAKPLNYEELFYWLKAIAEI